MASHHDQPWQPVHTQGSTGRSVSIFQSYDPLDEDSQSETGGDSTPAPAVQDKKKEEHPQKSVGTFFISDWYVWEVLAMVVSAGTLIAMVAMLIQYDQKPQPAWKHLSLNSVISWLGTISKVCVLFSINECIGQLKWVWFEQRQRSMMDVRLFDFASRGFYGSGVLIWILKARHFAVWGSLAVILALAFDPFIQNLIRYYPTMVVDPSQKAFLSNSTSFTAIGAPARGANWVDSVLKGNVYSSLFNADQSKPWAIPQYLCSSSNCTWDPVASLGARAVCSNVTDHLLRSCHNTTLGSRTVPRSQLNCSLNLPNSETEAWFLPKSVLLQPLAVRPMVKTSDALVYKNATFPPIQFIAAQNITTSRDGYIRMLDMSTTWQAIECSIEPVVQSIRARVENNIYHEEVLATWAQSKLVNTSLIFQPNWGPEFGTFPTQNFSLDARSASAISSLLTEIFNGALVQDNRLNVYYMSSALLYAGADVIEALSTGNVSGCSLEAVEKFPCSMHNVAAAISKSFRDSAYISADSDPVKAQIAAGDVRRSMTYIAVQWQWIALPILVWLLGVVTLIGTVWKTLRAGAPKWRNDPLPLLFLYRQNESEGVSDRGINEKANALKVKMYESDQKRLLGS